jgi:hypothetical protein
MRKLIFLFVLFPVLIFGQSGNYDNIHLSGVVPSVTTNKAYANPAHHFYWNGFRLDSVYLTAPSKDSTYLRSTSPIKLDSTGNTYTVAINPDSLTVWWTKQNHGATAWGWNNWALGTLYPKRADSNTVSPYGYATPKWVTDKGYITTWSETDPVFSSDSAKILHWSDSIAKIATKHDLTLKQNILTNPVTGTGTLNYIPKWLTGGASLGDSPIIVGLANVGIACIPYYRCDVAGDLRIQSTNKLWFGGTADIGNDYLYAPSSGIISTASRFQSTLAVGTSPFAVTSTTLNTNLNADLLDSHHWADVPAGVDTTTAGTGLVNKTRMSHLSSYPTLNQNTTGTAAGLATAYIDWTSGSGGNSIANKPTLQTIINGTGFVKASGTSLSYDNSTYITSNGLPNVTNDKQVKVADSNKTVAGNYVTGKRLDSIAALKQNILTNPVTGTGTLNYIPKWLTGGASLGDSPIYTDGTNVSIGTTVPGYKLQVAGTTHIGVDGFLAGDITGVLQIGGAGTYYMTQIKAINTASNPGVLNTRMGFFTLSGTAETAADATEKMSILAQSGNVGIGTVAPLSKLAINGGLHIGGDSDAGDNNILADGTITAPAVYTTSVGSTNKPLFIDNTGLIGVTSSGVITDSLAWIHNATRHSAYLRNSTDRVTIGSSATTANVNRKLHVIGSMALNDTIFWEAGGGTWLTSIGEGLKTNYGLDCGWLTSAATYATTVGATNRDLYIDNTGVIGYVSSSRRFKKNITPMESINWLYKLNPVNFIYKKDTTAAKQYGLIAEDVEKVNKSLVSYGKDGLPETVNYSTLITPMLKAIQAQQKEIQELKQRIKTLEKK